MSCMYYDELNLKWIFIPKTPMNKLYVSKYVWTIKRNMWMYFNIGLKHTFFLKTQSLKRFVKTKSMLIRVCYILINIGKGPIKMQYLCNQQ